MTSKHKIVDHATAAGRRFPSMRPGLILNTIEGRMAARQLGILESQDFDTEADRNQACLAINAKALEILRDT